MAKILCKLIIISVNFEKNEKGSFFMKHRLKKGSFFIKHRVVTLEQKFVSGNTLNGAEQMMLQSETSTFRPSLCTTPHASFIFQSNDNKFT